MPEPRLCWKTKNGKSIAMCGDVMLVVTKVKTGQHKGTWQYGTTERYYLVLESAQDAAERDIERRASNILNALKGLS